MAALRLGQGAAMVLVIMNYLNADYEVGQEGED
jgi:hypothetical protein